MLETPRRPTASCPNCRATLSNVQGVPACPACTWVGTVPIDR